MSLWDPDDPVTPPIPPPPPPYEHEQQGYDADAGIQQRRLSLRSIPELRRASTRAEFGTLSLLDALDQDDRPTFAIDLSNVAPAVVYCNPVLAVAKDLLAKICGQESPTAIFENAASQAYHGFHGWLVGDPGNHEQEQRGKTYMFEGHIWAAITLGHLKVMSGVPNVWPRPGSVLDKPHSSPSSPANDRERKRPRHRPQIIRAPRIPTSKAPSAKQASYDYTLDPPPANMSEHLLYFRSVDWAHTPLGPMHKWSPQLRCIVNMILNNSYPSVLFWGEDVAMIYNEAYIEVIGLLHPCMGLSARFCAKEYWGHFQPLVDHINDTGEGISENDMPIFLDRHGFLEETYFSFQFIPILDNVGHVAGYYQPLVETTKYAMLERRVSGLVEIGSQTSKARDLATYWELVMNTLSNRISDKDAPFALLYAAEHQTCLEISSVSSPGSSNQPERCVLKGSIGVEADHLIAPSIIDMKDGSNVLLPYLFASAKSRKPKLVQLDQLDLPEAMLGIDWKGYGDPCRFIVICPIMPTTSERVQGFLILGINPRRPFDDDYQQFVQVLIRLLATSLASVVLFHEAIYQKEVAITQAAHTQEQLLSELQLKEKKFQRFAERADIAIYIIDPQTRQYIYRNQRWFEIFHVNIEDDDQDDIAKSWTRIVLPEDMVACEALFVRLVVDKVPLTVEIKTTIPFSPPAELVDPESEHHEHTIWILCSAYAELGPDGQIVEIVGNVTDISKQKWAESMQKIRTESALESKRHLELFIDSTSHEMRNPLSAIMQCADGILSSYCTPDGVCDMSSAASYTTLLEQTLDAAQTISGCAQHMKRIVDDVLTISKLDSGLLVITPIDAQPEQVANHAVKMFEAEAKAAGVDMKFEVEQSYRDLSINWVSLDPTRLLQVLINLVTNAIKFTRLEPIRLIEVSVGASASKPVSASDGVQFMDTKLADDDCHLTDDWKQGSLVYLQFSVKDTGRGLPEAERCNLFARFSQASPRTHINYGGSGLGLFISRRLTEMQGGAIGLSSEYGRGSIFSFYIKARRTATPNTPKEIDGMIPAQAPRLPTEPELNRDAMVKTLHVLIVEDNIVNQKVLAKQLKNLGCVVTVANHGGECLEFLTKTKHWKRDASSPAEPESQQQQQQQKQHTPSTEPPPDSSGTQNGSSSAEPPLELSLILMDWEMPVMNGLTAVSRIRELERSSHLISHIPVIGVTANARQQQIDAAMQAGMDDVVVKPFRVKELVVRMRAVLERGGIGASVGSGDLASIQEGEDDWGVRQ
ncbi:hypothetical protein K504DRAFT_410476 [Pleomassaria siparia CBS 279.74]|uniref:Uncharacterized protein n=1 Tax=Pleomassaria siparia CBS 279.74 TaxID=1314801 RepID=A0A6G1K5C0_9PLEO|nr:hypothetical protein K504DRAFT_410476 [Pleomassaria siparia CBS 279.74]